MGNLFSKKKEKEEAIPKAEVEEAQPTGVASSGDFAQEILTAHNVYRAKHGVKEMALNQKMCESAQSYAEKLSKENALNHSNTEDGENLAYSSGKMSGQATADMWYNEIKDYNFEKPGYSSQTGHFTQVVWKASEEFGVGVAFGQNSTFVVGRYRPAGNMNTSEQFAENVTKAISN